MNKQKLKSFHPCSTKMSTTANGQPSETHSKAGSTLWSALGTLWRAWNAGEDEELSAENAAWTLFRLFRSKHVDDLRLIAELATYLFVAYFGFVLLIDLDITMQVFLHPATSTTSLTPQTPSTSSGFLHSLLHILYIIFVYLRYVVYIVFRYFKVLGQYFGPAIPIYGAIVAWAYMSAATRLGVVDLFACEISTVCRVGTVFDIGNRYVAMYDGTDDVAKKPAAGDRVPAKQATDEQTSRSFVSSEGYFPIFDSNSRDLQSLEALVVVSITEYYTYMKAVRDLQRKLASIDPPEISKPSEQAPNGSPKADKWHETLTDIIYVLFLGYESARKSVSDLIEFQPTRAEDIVVILMTELVCFSFLCEHFKDDEVRFRRLELREADYQDTVPALVAKVNAPHQGNEKHWAPAQRLISELDRRYKAALETLRKCRDKRIAATASQQPGPAQKILDDNGTL